MNAAAVTTAQALAELSRVMPALHLPGTAGYDAAVAAWNLAVPVRPIAVIAATGVDDVVAAVRFGRRHQVQVAVQSTGHGAVSDLDGVLLVSTRLMTGLEIHAEERWVRAEAGVTGQQVLDATAPHGLACLAGAAPSVGVVGYITGGGLGPLARTHGLACDQVRAFEVVTGDGEVRRITTADRTGLFWGLRGGRGMLGLVTAVELDLLPISEIYGGTVCFDGQDAATVLQLWAVWCTRLPPEATTSVALLRLPDRPSDRPGVAPGVRPGVAPGERPVLEGRLVVAVRFAWTGPAARGARVLAPIRSAAAPLLDTAGPMPYSALGSIHGDPAEPMPFHEEAVLLRDLPPEAITRLLEFAGPDADCPQVLVEVRQLGGAIRTGSRTASAVPGRDAAFCVLATGPGDPPAGEAVTAHGRAIVAALRPWAHEGGLPNFAPRADVVWLLRVYGLGRLKRLRRLAKAYDPDGVLFGAQALRASVTAGVSAFRTGLRRLFPIR